MEEVTKLEDGLRRLQTAGQTAPPITYNEVYQRLSELQERLKLRIIESKSQLYRAQTLRDSYSAEVTAILEIVAPEKLPEFRRIQDPNYNPDSVRVGTQHESSSIALETIEEDGSECRKTPRQITPSGKLILKHKFAARCTPVSILRKGREWNLSTRIETPVGNNSTPVRDSPRSSRKRIISSKKTHLSVVKRKSLDYLDVTPEMPRSRKSRLMNRSSTKKINFVPGSSELLSEMTLGPRETESTQKLIVTPKPNESTLHPGGNDSTPQMKERVSFFSNPNVANIHRRYVAIQDSTADESTCLLVPQNQLPKKSYTPPLPMSSQKKSLLRTPVHEEKTPPLPQSSVKKKRVVTPEKPSDSAKKKAILDKTPTPPRARRARQCLQSKLDAVPLNVANPMGLRTDSREPVPKGDISKAEPPEVPTYLFKKPDFSNCSQKTKPLKIKDLITPKVSSTDQLFSRPRVLSARAPLTAINFDQTLPLPKQKLTFNLRKEVTEKLPIKNNSINNTLNLSIQQLNESQTSTLRPSKMLQKKR